MTPLPRPSELLLLSPRTDTDEAFQELAQRLWPVVAPLPVRVIHGDASGDRPPEPGAALVTGGRPEALQVLGSMPSEGGGWRWVHLTSSGPDPLHDWPILPGRPLITYSRGVNARSIAEWAIGAILHFRRDFDRYLLQAAERRWERQWAKELTGSRLVVVGAGSAGSEVALLARALGMETVGISRSGRELPGFDRIRTDDELDAALASADVAVVLLPLTDKTRGSFGEERIRTLPADSLLLVASRGGIVDEDAVAAAVREGRLRGAAFDVFAEEPLPDDSLLWREPGVLVTPHVAGTTDRFMAHTARILETIWQAVYETPDPEALAPFMYVPTIPPRER